MEYHVFLTPRGDAQALYVSNESANGFEVRESGNGTHSVAFDYRIVAKRRGHETERLVDVTVRETQQHSLPVESGENVAKCGRPASTRCDLARLDCRHRSETRSRFRCERENRID